MSTAPSKGVGIFGCGVWLPFLTARLRSAGFTVEGIWSSNIQNAAAYGKHLQVPFHTDKIDELLLYRSVDLVLIFCPHQATRNQILTKALRIAKHVLCQYPPASGSSEARHLCTASAYYPSTVSGVFFPLRAVPQFEQIRSLLLDRELIGPCTSIELRLSGSDLFDLTSLLQHLTPDAFAELDRFCSACSRPRLSIGSAVRGHSPRRYPGCELFTSLLPHLLDLISHVSGLRANRVSALVRSFIRRTENGNRPANVSSITRNLSSEDYCHVQMEMVTRFTSKRVVSATGNKESSVNRSFKVARKANVGPIAIISIDGRPFDTSFTCDLMVYGTHGYLSLRNDHVYSKQYEQNNNDAKQNEPVEMLQPSQSIFNGQSQLLNATLEETYCSCRQQTAESKSAPESQPLPQPQSQPQQTEDLTAKSASNDANDSQKASNDLLNNAWPNQYAFLLDRFVSDLQTRMSSSAWTNTEQPVKIQNADSVQPPIQFTTASQSSQQPGSASSNESQTSVKSSAQRDSTSVKLGTFDDVLYLQEVVAALQRSVTNREWAKVLPFDPKIGSRLSTLHLKSQQQS